MCSDGVTLFMFQIILTTQPVIIMTTWLSKKKMKRSTDQIRMVQMDRMKEVTLKITENFVTAM